EAVGDGAALLGRAGVVRRQAAVRAPAATGRASLAAAAAPAGGDDERHHRQQSEQEHRRPMARGRVLHVVPPRSRSVAPTLLPPGTFDTGRSRKMIRLWLRSVA